MLELFPEDAASIRYGQKVSTQVQSLPGRELTGRVAFIDPQVDPKTRTVSVRSVMPNESGQLRVWAITPRPRLKSRSLPIRVSSAALYYDPQLAHKWISPRHPQLWNPRRANAVVCGVDLVSRLEPGFHR